MAEVGKYPCYFEGDNLIIECPSEATKSLIKDAIESGDVEFRINEELG